MTLHQSGEAKLCCIKKQTRNLSGLTHKHLFLARENLGGLVEAGVSCAPFSPSVTLAGEWGPIWNITGYLGRETRSQRVCFGFYKLWLGSVTVTYAHSPLARNSHMSLPYCREPAFLLAVAWGGLQGLRPTPLLLLILEFLELLSSLLVTLSPGFRIWFSDPLGRVPMIPSFQKFILGRGAALLKNCYTSSFSQVVSMK